MSTVTSPLNGGAKEPSGQEVDGILKRDEAKGGAVHSFDPEATPAEKAAAAGKARDQVKSIRKQGGEHGGTGESRSHQPTHPFNGR